jgi:hypothetical protein
MMNEHRTVLANCSDHLELRLAGRARPVRDIDQGFVLLLRHAGSVR